MVFIKKKPNQLLAEISEEITANIVFILLKTD